MATYPDFRIKAGLRVASNIVVGNYSGITNPIENGLIVSGEVGIGTTTVQDGNILAVQGSQTLTGNIFISDGGIVFSDGSFQSSANLIGPTGPTGAASETIGPTGPVGPTGTTSLGNVLITDPENNDLLAYNYSSNTWVNIPAIYDVAITISGGTLSNEILLQYILPVGIQIPIGATGSYAIANTAAASTTVFNMNKNGVNIGNITWAASGTTANFAVESEISFASGDILQIVAPESPDADLADIGITIAATRS